MVVIVFRSRIKLGVEREIGEMGGRMYELAVGMPGFVSYNEYTSGDGENVAIVEFESHEALTAWREYPEHRVAQAAGRGRFFSSPNTESLSARWCGTIPFQFRWRAPDRECCPSRNPTEPSFSSQAQVNNFYSNEKG